MMTSCRRASTTSIRALDVGQPGRWRWSSPRRARRFQRGDQKYALPPEAGWCSNPMCDISDDEVAAFRQERRGQGWIKPDGKPHLHAADMVRKRRPEGGVKVRRSASRGRRRTAEWQAEHIEPPAQGDTVRRSSGRQVCLRGGSESLCLALQRHRLVHLRARRS
jgi:hypothetical protein